MSFLYLEARKGILRRYTLIALALFLCLNTVKIIADYHAGEIRPVAANTSGMQAGYDTIYERIKGPITEEIVRFLTSEYQRLDGLTADGTYSREPQEGTYSGYIFGDYYLLHSYFYPHMEYSVKYSSDMEEILAQAEENVTFYQESGNTAGAAENAYISADYVSCVDAMQEISVKDMDIYQKYILANSYVRSENLTQQQKENIISNLSLKETPARLEYWIYLGRNDISEAIDIAMQQSDDEMLLYAYMKQKSMIETDSSLSGEEKTQELEKIAQKMQPLMEKYDTEEE